MKPVKIYTTDYCSYCVQAKKLLTRKNVPFEEIDVTGDDAGRAELIRMSGGLRTVPQIFIGDFHVGGYDRLSELDRSGKLDELLA
ncbi:glutaredoxin 3 [Vulgatibacter incomptus]|uniref:Glutaredoxin n=1 Tax=Vulgatibacter incomptus TaxID=1391653 RepID=A0A0K1PE32_9BACT|nr:glutaredoxin 3 [Vulgatibacter incomptus]AKU91384.1 Glutaredoxin 3 (Grx2) [Vulgatibacter incomptus]